MIDPGTGRRVRVVHTREPLEPGERFRVFEVLAVGGCPSAFRGLWIGPETGRTLCRYRHPGGRAELIELPTDELVICHPPNPSEPRSP